MNKKRIIRAEKREFDLVHEEEEESDSCGSNFWGDHLHNHREEDRKPMIGNTFLLLIENIDCMSTSDQVSAKR